MPLKIICCYALFVIVTGILRSGNQKSSAIPLSAGVTIKPSGAADSVISNGAAANINSLQYNSFGSNAGN